MKGKKGLTRSEVPTPPGTADHEQPPSLTPLLGQALQLCASHRRLADDPEAVIRQLTGTHLFQPKLDGMRALAVVDGASVALRSRMGEDISRVYPEVCTALAKLNLRTALDGELVHYGPDGLPAFTAMSWRNSQRNATAIARLSTTVPVSFVVFDALWLDGDMRQRPLTDRVAAVESLGFTGTIQRCPSVDDGLTLWDQVQELQLEGLVAKSRTSRYTGKRCQDWVKIKTVHTASVIVGNVLATDRRTVGKVEVHAFDGEDLVSLGEVGTGWTDRELANLAHRVRLYASDPTRTAPVVIDVNFAGRYPDGKLKFAAFVGVRDDIDWTTCTIDQEGL